MKTKIFASVPIFLLWALGLSAQSFILDMRQPNFLSYQLTGPGINIGNVTRTEQNFTASGPGTCLLELCPREGTCAWLRFQINAAGKISSLYWKDADSSQTGGNFVPLPVTFYDLKNGGKKLVLKSKKQKIDVKKIDLDNVTVIQSGITIQGGKDQDILLFPGDYLIEANSANSKFAFQVGLDAQFRDSLTWRDSGIQTSDFEFLRREFYKVTGALLQLTGNSFNFEIQYATGQDWSLLGMKRGLGLAKPLLPPVTLRLLPGQYTSRTLSRQGNAEAEITYTILNENGETGEWMTWKDLVGDQTDGNFIFLEEGLIFRGRKYYILTQKIPPIQIPPSSAYATLKTMLDGGHYTVHNDQLWFKYEERYNDTSFLSYRILDPFNNDVTPNQNLVRAFGANWYKLSLGAAGFIRGKYYILEVTNQKGDTGKLRFKY